MPHLRATIVSTAWLVATLAGHAAASQYSDPAGFSFTYPPGWAVVARAREAMKQAPPSPEIQAWLENNNVDLSKVNVMLLHQEDDEFAANLNVVVNQGEVTLSDGALEKFIKDLPQRYKSMGARVDNVVGRVERVGVNKAFVVEYRITFPFAAVPMRQKQLCIPGGGKTFVVTCTDRADTFKDRAPAFDAILASFRVPAPLAQGLDWETLLNPAFLAGLAFGLAVGVAGGLFVLFRTILRPRRPATEADAPPPAL